MKKLSSIIWFMLSLLILLLAGCGGDSGSSPAITGVAIAGAPLIGTVSLKDSSVPVRTRTATIAPDGSFRFALTGLKLPCILKASGVVNNLDQNFYSLATGEGIANITPLSSFALALANNGDDPAGLYAVPDPAKLQAVATDLFQAVTTVRTILKPTLDKFGVAGVNFITDPLIANHQGLDLLFDLSSITVGNKLVTLYDKMAFTGKTIILENFTNGSYDFIANPVTTVGTLCIVPGSVHLTPGSIMQFSAFIIGSTERHFTWSLDETGVGSIMSTGLYTAPVTSGSYHVRATNTAQPKISASVLVTVDPPKNVLTVITTAPGAYTVMGSNLDNVGGAEIEISFDPGSLADPEITKGALIEKTMFISVPKFAYNKVKFVFITQSPISGSGPLATLTFDPLVSEPPAPFISKYKLVNGGPTLKKDPNVYWGRENQCP